MKMVLISHDHYQISLRDAKSFGKLPAEGKEHLVTHEGKNYFLSQTPVNGEWVWCVRPTNWKMKDGRMVLEMADVARSSIFPSAFPEYKQA